MSKYNIIAIERQFGSGGREIGRLAAEKLGIKFYNEEILDMAAKSLNIPSDYVKHAEETVSKSLLYAFAIAANPTDYSTDLQLADKLFYEESKLIKDIAIKEKCLIVGRCASGILKERNDCLKIFIYANENDRIKRCIEEYGISKKNASNEIHKNDKRRSEFYDIHSGKKWSDKNTYDILLNSSTIGIEGCAEIIAGFVR